MSLAAGLALGACKSGGGGGEAPVPVEQTLRERADALLDPIVPVEGLDQDRVMLGARLYHDPNLSGDGTVSCASCHAVPDGGDDGAVSSTGIGGQVGPINSPTTLNSHLNFVQFWDGRAASLEEQAAGPVANPSEMGSSIEAAVAYLQSEPTYVDAFTRSFGGTIDQASITTAIADYERTLTTPNSPFDRWLAGDDAAMSEQAVAGLTTFLDTGCTSCHRGAGVGGTSYEKMGVVHNYFERRGGELTAADMGRFNVTQSESDRHKFKVPLLRNVALTAPYFHDGSAETLAEAVETMAYVQLGRELTAEQTSSLVAFMEALSGEIPTVDVAALNLPAARTGGAPTDPTAVAVPAAPAAVPAADGSAAVEGSAQAP